MTCDGIEERIRKALKEHENDPHLDELTKVTPDELRHTNAYKEKQE